MSNYDDDQSEDGELARSPVQDEMDFSLSDEDRDNADSLVIKPPQAVIRSSHREKRSHKRSGKDRYKEIVRKDKKHFYRDRDKSEKSKRGEVTKNLERDEMTKEYYREKQYYREKDPYREKEVREKEIYREREIYREKDVYKERDPYREREHYREREMYRDNTTSFREATRQRDMYREKDVYKEKEVQKDREMYMSRDRQNKYSDNEKKRLESDRIESRLRLLAEESRPNHSNEKENRDKTSGDKELEDLRTRLLSKRISKELQNQETRKSDYSDKESKSDDRQRHSSSLDRHQQERRKRLIEAEKEMEKRKHESRNELEARREERRRRGKKRSVSPDDGSNKKKRNHSPIYDAVVTVSDASDVEMKSDSLHSEPEEGEHSNSETDDDSTTDSDSEADSKSGDDNEIQEKSDKEDKDVKEQDVDKAKTRLNSKSKSKSPSPKSAHRSPSSHGSGRSHSRSKSRSRSHSFSPPPPGENGKTPAEEEKPEEDNEKLRLKEEAINLLPPYYPALQGCRSVEEFQCLNRIEEGTYGVVYRARDKTTEEIVALKRLKMEKEKEGFPITSLREINTLLKGQHPNIVTVREIVVGSNMDKIFIVMDYVEHDLKSLMETMRGKKQVFLPGEIKCLMTQLLKAVHHLHDNWILHRDLKTSNLLLSHKGVLKVGDFGLAREYGSPLRQYTPIVVTLWYRAPELLLCCKEYSTPIDMWSVGCIFAEFITMNPLFPGKSEVDQLNRIFKDLGTPSELLWPGYNELPAVQKMTFAEHPPGGLRQRIGSDLLSDTGLSLLQGFLTYNPARRLTAEAALEHAYFKEQPVAIEPAMFPTWPAKSEGNRRTTHSPRPPAGGAAYAQYARADSDEALGFQLHARSLNVAPGFSLKF
ncbi:unnamed protein product [Parnassius mnemosyne]|uniref:cyclin-dependent kinase n=1 Tax=Parnassius mnemosyne TaxID=213953 RepID=A0AAV1KFX6_9NEOP